MSRGYVVSLVTLAALWGSSFMFVEIALEELSPVALIEGRLLVAGVILTALAFARLGPRTVVAETRRTFWPSVVLGVLNCAVPYTLIAWGQTHIDSGIAAIGNAAVPIFVALLAIRFIPSERVTGWRLLGVLVGFAGVGVLAGVDPRGGIWGTLGTLAVVAATFSYAVANLYTQHWFRGTSPMLVAATSTVAAGILLAGPALFLLPAHVPSWETLAAVGALGVVGHALAHLAFYRMLLVYGSSRTSLVTYVTPFMALTYGVFLLGEPLTVTAIVALALVLVGVAIGSGLVRAPGRGVAPAVPRG